MVNWSDMQGVLGGFGQDSIEQSRSLHEVREPDPKASDEAETESASDGASKPDPKAAARSDQPGHD